MIFNRFWQYWIRRTARAHGFIDPITLMSRLSRFAKPSEVTMPVEVLRIGFLLQARGFINSVAIQHNLDWVWPYWVNKQFDPRDPSFIPRAFSLTHINLTHRNWTAVGIPDFNEMPIVDPRGLVTPHYDGWSIDGWIISPGGNLLPSRAPQATQYLNLRGNLSVVTETSLDGAHLKNFVEVITDDQDQPVCRIHFSALNAEDSWLVVSLRPCNPEGVSLIHQIKRIDGEAGWLVDDRHAVFLSAPWDRMHFSHYTSGDVLQKVMAGGDKESSKVECDVGMATAAAMYRLQAGRKKDISVEIPLEKTKSSRRRLLSDKIALQSWESGLTDACVLRINDAQHQFLYDSAVRTLILHAGQDVYPGPYTYKHFWFRDAAVMFYALLCTNQIERCRRITKLFFKRQRPSGYFASQDGEWDSNGQVLWALYQFWRLTNERLPEEWKPKIHWGLRWIRHKRLSDGAGDLHAGLMPAGFSAEHLGPNDFYYWDDFWSVKGLRCGEEMMRHFGETEAAQKAADHSAALMKAVERSLEKISGGRDSKAMPSSPYRRLDSASIGSIAVGYPLQLWEPKDRRLIDTVEFLLDNCFVNNGFFHDMSHSGINPYLTLYVAQVLLRAGDIRFYHVMNTVANLASATGQWPEAVHPQTLGGCMGDGQHAWAAAEWLIMVRNCFVYEEPVGNKLVLCAGVHHSWYENIEEASFGPAPTAYGRMNIRIRAARDKIFVSWEGSQWYGDPPQIEIRFPETEPLAVPKGQNSAEISR